MNEDVHGATFAVGEAPSLSENSPPAYVPPPAASPSTVSGQPRTRRPLIIAVLALALVVVVAIGYAAIGYAFAQSRLSDATNAYNTVVDHQNKLTEAVNALSTKLTGANLTSVSTADLQQDKTLIDQLIAAANQAQTQIAIDDPLLAKTDAGLNLYTWLTVISRSDLDKASTRIGYDRKALAEAKIITADYLQLGAFYQAYLDTAIDFEALDAKAQTSDFSAIAAANEKLKADVARAIQLDAAPGLPSTVDTFLHDVQALATDVTNLLNAAAAGDQTAFDAASKAGDADASKVDSYDFDKIGNEINAFYKPLIDAYNSEVDKANNT